MFLHLEILRGKILFLRFELVNQMTATLYVNLHSPRFCLVEWQVFLSIAKDGACLGQ